MEALGDLAVGALTEGGELLVLIKSSFAEFDRRRFHFVLHELRVSCREAKDLRLIFHVLVDFVVKRIDIIIRATVLSTFDKVSSVHLVG